MYRGTTPTITISTDMDLTKAHYVVVTIEDFQGNEVHVDSNSGMLQITQDTVSAKLSQEQTLLLTKGRISLQIRAVDASGNAVASNIMTGQLYDILKEGEIP